MSKRNNIMNLQEFLEFVETHPNGAGTEILILNIEDREENIILQSYHMPAGWKMVSVTTMEEAKSLLGEDIYFDSFLAGIILDGTLEEGNPAIPETMPLLELLLEKIQVTCPIVASSTSDKHCLMMVKYGKEHEHVPNQVRESINKEDAVTTLAETLSVPK